MYVHTNTAGVCICMCGIHCMYVHTNTAGVCIRMWWYTLYVCMWYIAPLCNCPNMFLFLPSCLPPRLSPSPPPTSHPSQLPQHVSEGGTFGPDTVTDAVQNCWRTVSFPPSPHLLFPSPFPLIFFPLFLTHPLTPSPPHPLTPSPPHPITPSQGEQPAHRSSE